MNGSSARSLGIFLVVVLAVGTAIGVTMVPGPWYAALRKPLFNPPPWIFPPVWTTLYVMIAIAGWRIWSKAPLGAAMKVWALQMVLNWSWSPLFFGLHRPWLAFAVIAALLATIMVFIALARRVDRVALWLFVPYAAWVAFASQLNASLAWMN
jgi:tryptophan-rich sensory protein